MSTIIISATSQEIEPLLSHSKCNQYSKNEYKVNDVLVIITGIGLLETTYNLLTRITPSVDLILQVGIAGAYNNTLKLGEVVEVVSEQYGDLGAENHDSFLTLKEIGLTSSSLYEDGKIINPPYFNQLKNVDSISVNTVAGSAKTIEERQRLFNPDIENMEGLALFRVCKAKGIRCAQIRSISNVVEPRNRDNWELPLAVKQLNQFIMEEIVH